MICIYVPFQAFQVCWCRKLVRKTFVWIRASWRASNFCHSFSRTIPCAPASPAKSVLCSVRENRESVRHRWTSLKALRKRVMRRFLKVAVGKYCYKKVAQIFSEYMGYFENINLKYKTAMATVWPACVQIWAYIYSNILSRWVLVGPVGIHPAISGSKTEYSLEGWRFFYKLKFIN